MKKSIAKNYLYNLAYQILVMFLPLITTPYISRVLGANSIGIYSYTLSITTFFILFGSLGVALYGQREIAYHQNNKEKYSRLFWEIIILRFATMFISFIIYYFNFINGSNEYNIYYKILILEIISNAVDISWFFQGLEEFKKIILRNTFIKIISLILIFVLVKTSNDLPVYFWIYAASLFFGNISLWFYLPKYLDRIKLKELRVFRHLKPTVMLFIPQIAIQLYTVLDKTMIGSIVSDKSEVGFYEQAQKIIKMLLTIITSLGVVMMPRVANFFANKDKEKIDENIKKSFSLVFLLSFPLIFFIFTSSDAFVPLFFGAGYEKTALIMKIISPIILFIGLSNVIGTQYLLPTKRQKEYTISVIAGSCINAVFNLILIPEYGAIGASIGTIIAELVVTGTQMYCTKNDFNFIKVIKIAQNYLIAGILVFILNLLISQVVAKGIIFLLIQALISFLFYISLLVLMKDEFIGFILKKILNRKLKSNKENLIESTVKHNKTRKQFIAKEIIRLNPEVIGVYRLTMKHGSDNFRSSAIQDIINIFKEYNKTVVIYEPTLNEQEFNGCRVVNNLNEFKNMSSVIIANRFNPKLSDVSDKVYTHDLFMCD